MAAELREFVFRYMMRVSDFHAPDTVVDKQTRALPGWMSSLTFCPQSGDSQRGFGYTQLYYKLRNGQYGRAIGGAGNCIVW